MALKLSLSKAEVDSLPEPIRKEYQEKDGQFVLAVEGMPDPKEVLDLKTKLGEFRENNRKLFTENEELKTLKTKFEGVDPEKYRDMASEIEKLRTKGVGKAEDISSIVEAAIAKATKPINDQLEAEKRARAEAQERVVRGEFTKRITEVALKAGVRPQAIDKILPLAERSFEFKEDAIVPREGAKHPTEPHKDLTTDAWLAELAKSDEYLFAPSSGSGGKGSDRRTAAGVKLLINPTSEEMGRNADALAKGEMVVQRT